MSARVAPLPPIPREASSLEGCTTFKALLAKVRASPSANSITYQSRPCPSHIANDSSRVHERKSEAVVQSKRDGSGVAVADIDTSLRNRDLLNPLHVDLGESSRPYTRTGVKGLQSRDHVALNCSIEVLLWRLPCVFCSRVRRAAWTSRRI
jgi:hypothetical protein